MLSGYKTYIVVAVLLITVFVEKVLGADVPGIEISGDWMLIVLNALGLGSLRAGIGKLKG